MACVDVAAKSKLFGIIVDTLETAKKVLQINKEIKGGVINIYPLETLDQIQKPSKSIPSGVKSMLDIVQLSPSGDQRLQHLLSSIFAKVVLVKSYDEGMQVAKEHNFTCITADLEVVYAGAFISKVGHYNRA
jgi:chromosome segregation ATPase